MQAVVPAPDGGYPNFTTAEGQNALKDLTSGAANTALGAYSMFSTTTGSFNTAVGAGALDLNTGDQNTAVGVAALLLNTGMNNTAVGAAALESNSTGSDNTANGAFALFSNSGSSQNTAVGYQALYSNNTGSNTAVGYQALFANTTGAANIALGSGAGFNVTTGSNNVYIGTNVGGPAGESNTCYIASIFASTSFNGIPVLVNSNNKLGTMTSSKRFKEDIKPMDKVSEALFSLTPVTFHYKKEIDPAGTPQLGLVAEDVEKVNPDLVVPDKEGKPYTVRYDAVNAMLLNEFLKEHRTVQEQQKEIDTLKAELKEQRSLIQKVSAQLELNKSAPQTVANNQ